MEKEYGAGKKEVGLRKRKIYVAGKRKDITYFKVLL